MAKKQASVKSAKSDEQQPQPETRELTLEELYRVFYQLDNLEKQLQVKLAEAQQKREAVRARIATIESEKQSAAQAVQEVKQ